MTNPRYAIATETGRQYFHPHRPGERYWSVTWAIGNGIPKFGLKQWGERKVAEKAWELGPKIMVMEREAAIAQMRAAPTEETEYAANRGTSVHKVLESLAQGEVPSVLDELSPWVESGKRFLRDFKPTFVLTETTVYNDRYRYAGSLDFLATLGNAPWLGCVLGDYKTGRDIYAEAGAQLAAYYNAEYYLDENSNEKRFPRLDGYGVVVHLTEEAYRVVPITITRDLFITFLHALAIARWSVEQRSSVLGAAIASDTAHPWDLEWLRKRIAALPTEGQLRLMTWARAKGLATKFSDINESSFEKIVEAVRRLEAQYKEQPTDTGKVIA